MEYCFLAADDQRVACIVATLETGYGRGPVGQQIDNLALALVAPLGANDNYIFSHDVPAASRAR